jgi:quercetin dioxygenase-like cupin family protein
MKNGPSGDSAEPLQINQILQTTQSWTGAKLPPLGSGQTEMRVITYTITPGTKTPIHLHPINGAGYIISGELTMFATEDPHGSFKDPSQLKSIVLKAGESWTETVNAWHYGINNGKEDVYFILIFAAQVGVPSTLSLDGADKC